jgi:hypothetical protein
MMTRAYILEVLEGELNALEDREPVTDHNAALHRVLLRLIADLETLEKGEVPPLFARKKVKARGKRPATLRKGRLIAIGAVRTLRKVGYSAEKAIKIVADEHAVSSEAICQWRKTLGKDTDPEALMLMAQLPSSYLLFGWTKEDLLKEVSRAGQAFRAARGKKGKRKKA